MGSDVEGETAMVVGWSSGVTPAGPAGIGGAVTCGVGTVCGPTCTPPAMSWLPPDMTGLGDDDSMVRHSRQVHRRCESAMRIGCQYDGGGGVMRVGSFSAVSDYSGEQIVQHL